VNSVPRGGELARGGVLRFLQGEGGVASLERGGFGPGLELGKRVGHSSCTCGEASVSGDGSPFALALERGLHPSISRKRGKTTYVFFRRGDLLRKEEGGGAFLRGEGPYNSFPSPKGASMKRRMSKEDITST